MDATLSVGQPRVLVSRSALLHNASLVRQLLAPGVRLCAMVKADAYGHGAAIVADTLANYAAEEGEPPAADVLAVVTLDEAAALPDTALPVLVLRPVENAYLGRERERLEAAIRAGWILTIGTIAAAGDVARIAMSMGKRALVQVMVDTGQCREGAPAGSIGALVAAIECQPALRLWGLGTHFVSSEEPDNLLTADQLRRFRSVTEAHAARNDRLIRHSANSGAIFHHPRAHLDMVRPGIALYGIDPTCKPCLQRKLRPVLKWTAPLVLIRSLRKGDSVGYNHTWTAPCDTRIGLVPVGYADGYERHFSNRGIMMVHGQPAPVVGRISMDYTTIDLRDVPDAALGDEVTVLDDDPLSQASVYALAALADTIPYEAFCHIGQRVHRVAAEDAAALARPAALQRESA